MPRTCLRISPHGRSKDLAQYSSTTMTLLLCCVGDIRLEWSATVWVGRRDDHRGERGFHSPSFRASDLGRYPARSALKEKAGSRTSSFGGRSPGECRVSLGTQYQPSAVRDAVVNGLPGAIQEIGRA